jgi:hypothetical protein
VPPLGTGRGSQVSIRASDPPVGAAVTEFFLVLIAAEIVGESEDLGRTLCRVRDRPNFLSHFCKRSGGSCI